MPYLLNLVYLLAGLLLSPWLLYRAVWTGRYRRHFASKWLGRVEHPRLGPTQKPRVWFHGVSVGEIHLLRTLVARFRLQHPDCEVVVSTTTETGHAEACKHFADLPVITFPFDFTWAVREAFDRVQPTLIVLAEGDLWPNFVRLASERGIRLALVNGRMSPRSSARYHRFRLLVGGLFRRFDAIAAQNADYAEQYRKLGARNVVVTGNLKYDGAQSDRQNSRSRSMRQILGLADDALVWVAGSTQDPEERLALEVYRRARNQYPSLRLILVPRHPERFDEVARLLERSGLPSWRRSSNQPIPENAILLVDTIGELGAIWGLADIAFVGGSLDGKRGGQNMIEPAAYGAAVVFGPHTWNFQRDVAQLLAQEAAIQIPHGEAMQETIQRLLGDASLRRQIGESARALVLSQQGATQATLQVLAKLLPASSAQKAA